MMKELSGVIDNTNIKVNDVIVIGHIEWEHVRPQCGDASVV